MRIFRLMTIVYLVILCGNLFAQDRIKGELFDYFRIESNTSSTLVFLHGSMAYYAQNQQGQAVTVAQLLEGNEGFLEAFKNYTIIIPIAHTGFNWLNDSAFVKLFDGLPELKGRDIDVI